MGEDSLERNAELDPFNVNVKSSVQISNTTRGITWKIKVVTGEEKLIVGLMEVAITAHKKINAEINLNGGK